MRTAVTEVRKHGKKKFETLFSSDVPIVEQQAAVRKLRGSTVHKEYAEVRYFESPRVTTFISPQEAKRREEVRDERAKKAAVKSEPANEIDAESKAPKPEEAAETNDQTNTKNENA